MNEAYGLAVDFALNEYEHHEDGHSHMVGAFLKGYELAKKGIDVVEKGTLINRVVFFFSSETRRFYLENPIWVSNRRAFTRELRRLTKIQNIGIYD